MFFLGKARKKTAIISLSQVAQAYKESVDNYV
jgi:hypothetical protein